MNKWRTETNTSVQEDTQHQNLVQQDKKRRKAQINNQEWKREHKYRGIRENKNTDVI